MSYPTILSVLQSRKPSHRGLTGLQRLTGFVAQASSESLLKVDPRTKKDALHNPPGQICSVHHKARLQDLAVDFRAKVVNLCASHDLLYKEMHVLRMKNLTAPITMAQEKCVERRLGSSNDICHKR